MHPLPRRLKAIAALCMCAALSSTLVATGAHAVDQTPGAPAPAASIGAPSTAASPVPALEPRSAVGGDRLARTDRQVERGSLAEPLGRIRAKSWILADAESGDVLAAKDPHRLLPPASTLKALTALTLLPQLALDTRTRATARAARIEGTRVGLIPGREYTVEQLMFALLLASGNDAAFALAKANGGVRDTVAEMNEVARSLRALDTVARNPSGLDAPGQVSSAYDLALIARAGLARQDFRDFVSTTTFEFPGKGRRSYPIYTQNDLLLDGYRGAIGVKTGFTSQAGRTFIAAAERKGRTLIFVGLGIKDSSAQTAAKALTWGFRNADKVTAVGSLEAPDATAAPVLTASPEPAPVDVSGAGLLVPAADDPMAPWWFWVLLLVGAVVGAGWLRVRRDPRRRRPSARVEPTAAIRLDYHPYDPR